jgi:hypothetical protein
MQQQNSGVMQPVSKQQISKHASTTIELLLETLFSIWSVQSGYKEDNWGNPVSNSKIVNNCTNDNELILPTMTDKRQTRPLVREGTPHGQDSNFQT